MSLAKRQALVARFLTDRALEAELRADPEAAAQRFGVDLALTRWLAALEPRRVRSFRKSRAVKDARRRGETDRRMR